MELVDVSGGYKPSDKGVGGHPDPEIRGGGLQKNCFRPFGSHFGRKIRGGGGAGLPGPSPGSATGCKSLFAFFHVQGLFVL